MGAVIQYLLLTFMFFAIAMMPPSVLSTLFSCSPAWSSPSVTKGMSDLFTQKPQLSGHSMSQDLSFGEHIAT